MEEILNEKIKEWARQETWYQLALALAGIYIGISFFSKHFKTIIEALPSIRKALALVQKWLFSNAIFRTDMIKKMDFMQLKLNEIEKEVKYNGGSIRTVDIIKLLEEKLQITLTEVKHLRGLRSTSDKYDDRMIFKLNDEGGLSFINDAFLRWSGWQESDIEGFNFENIIHPDCLPETRLKWQQSISHQTNFHQEQKIKKRDGTYHSAIVKATPITVEGNLKEIYGIIIIND